MLDTTSPVGILTEALCVQFPFWFIFLTKYRQWLNEKLTGLDWFEAMAKQKGGKSEWILFATSFPQHTTAALFLVMTRLTGDTSWFVHGIISEWAFEAIDAVNQARVYFHGGFNDNADGKKAFIAMMCHHIPGIIAILPATIYFQHVPEFRDVVWSLLGYAWLMLIFYLLGRTYRLNDLNERTRYTVLFVCGYAMTMYCRLYLFPLSMYRITRRMVWDVSWLFIALGVMYAVLMTGFNVIVIAVQGERLWKLSYGTTKEKEVAGRSLQRQTSNFLRPSWDILNDDEEDDEDEGYVRRILRTQSTPVRLEHKRSD